MTANESQSNGSITRIDAPHATQRIGPKAPEAAPVELVLAAAGQLAEQSGEQLSAQAGQLASYLEDRQRDVAGREAQLNARVAQLENELRTSRMWVRERDHEIAEKEKELQQRINDLETQLQGLSASELAIEDSQQLHRQQIEQQEQQIKQRERKLLEGQQRLADEAQSLGVSTERVQRQRAEVEEAARFEKQQLAREREAVEEQQAKLLSHLEKRKQALEDQEKQLEQRIQELEEKASRIEQFDQHGQRNELVKRMEREFQSRKTQLDDAEVMLAEHTKELNGERDQFELERERSESELDEQRQVLFEQQQQYEDQVLASRQHDDARSADVDRRVAAAEQVKQEALGTFREALEMRILVEELWAEVTRSTPPAQVTQRLGQLRVRLSDQFRLDRQDLDQKRAELRELGQRLETRSRELHQQKADLKDWMQRRETQIEAQAARLVKRELELDREADRFTTLQRESASDKRGLQAQIRQLSGELRRATVQVA